jgi:cell division protein FtsB
VAVASTAGRGVRLAGTGTRAATGWALSRTLGPAGYERRVEQHVKRLATALDALEAAIVARDAEIERLRTENDALRARLG